MERFLTIGAIFRREILSYSDAHGGHNINIEALSKLLQAIKAAEIDNMLTYGPGKREYVTFWCVLRYKYGSLLPQDMQRLLLDHAARVGSPSHITEIPRGIPHTYPNLADRVNLLFRYHENPWAPIENNTRLSFACPTIIMGCDCPEDDPKHECWKGYAVFKKIHGCNQATVPDGSTIVIQRDQVPVPAYILNIVRPDGSCCLLRIRFNPQADKPNTEPIRETEFTHRIGRGALVLSGYVLGRQLI